MVSSEEKREFMYSMFDKIAQSAESTEIQHNIYELLMRDTVEGKLYKYRSFDSEGYSISNLRDGTLHCSSPNSFNDPFDCKIGTTFESLYSAKYDVEFKVIFSLLEKFVMIINGELLLENCNKDEQRVIKKILSQEEMMSMITYHRSKNHTPEEVEIVIKENILLVLTLIQIVIEDKHFSPSLGAIAAILPKFVSKITTEDFMGFNRSNLNIQDYVDVNGIASDVDEIDATIALCKKIAPELTSAAYDVEKYINDKEERFYSTTGKLFKIGCLCTNYKNRLMWSHYADGHKGFCIEYDFSECDETTVVDLPFPVIYSTNRPGIPWKATIENTPENMQYANNEILLSLLTKDSAWEYENEWRIFIDGNEDSEYKMPKISCIYLGALISDVNRDKILRIAKEKSIPVKQMMVDRGQYDLHANSIFV